MRAPDFDIHKVIESLQGTCGTLSNTIEELYPGMTEDDLDRGDFDTIDNEIFECQTCNWWCEISEVCESRVGENECRDCHGDDDEE